MMADKQKSIFIRFNMDDKTDKELYLKLSEAAGDSASLTAYVKRMLQEYFTLNIKIAERQEFHNQMLSMVKEEMQEQGMKLVGALLSGIGMVNLPVPHPENVEKEIKLPDACEKLPEELKSVLDFIT